MNHIETTEELYERYFYEVSGNPDAEDACTNSKPDIPFIWSSFKRRGYTHSVIAI